MGPRRQIASRRSSSIASSSRPIAPNPILERKRANRNSKPLKAIFKGKYISSVGHFENCGKELGPDDIAKYVTAHGGVYERQVSDDTTHLICSIEEYKMKHPQVREAWKRGSKCSIVIFDWLLDCTISKSKSCRAAKGYTLDRTIKRLRKGKTKHEEFRKSFEEGVRASKELCDNRLYHIYWDSTGFEYEVVLIRINIGAHTNKPMVEKYTLYLFESHAIPHLYMCGAKLSRSHRPSAHYREACHAMEFKEAFKHFQHFFKDKTGVDWDMRLERPARGLESVFNGNGVEEVLTEAKKFVFTPPVLGRPVGLLPWGYVRPEEREDMVTTTNETTNTGIGSEDEDEDGRVSRRSMSESGTGAETINGYPEDVVYDTDSDVDDSSDEEDDSDKDEDEDEDENMEDEAEAEAEDGVISPELRLRAILSRSSSHPHGGYSSRERSVGTEERPILIDD